jgi:predicted glycoside hydrolase/deacetylase ChbG (UPF0249 family)
MTPHPCRRGRNPRRIELRARSLGESSPPISRGRRSWIGIGTLIGLLGLVVAGSTVALETPETPETPETGRDAERSDRLIRLLVRADDLGAALAVNEASMKTVDSGIARSVEVIVPGPWFRDAVERLRGRDDIDIGVHLTLTSEWERVRWGPISQGVPSLVDLEGKFFPMTSQRADFPPGTGFLECGWKIEEVERELRAQIELARKELPKVTHLSAHMGTATANRELRELVDRLAKEYELPIRFEGLQSLRGFGGAAADAATKEAKLVELLEALGPGTWLIVEHPGFDNDEMRAMGHKGYENVAADRDGVTRAFTSARVREVIERRGIELIGYDDLLQERK